MKMEEKDKKRILVKLDEMNRYMEELSEMLPTEEEYYKNLTKRRACEKTIELAIESLIDVAALVVSSEKFGLPSDESNIIDLLVENKILGTDLGEKVKNIKGFRNIIVHKYGGLDDKLVYRFLTENITDFDEFTEQVKEHMRKNKKK